MIRLFRCHQ